MEIAFALLGVLCGIAIALYATWLLVERLRSGEGKAHSFREWLKNMFEAIWGL